MVRMMLNLLLRKKNPTMIKPAGAFLTSLMIGWFASKRIVRDEFMQNCGSFGPTAFNIWLFLVRFVVPVCILLIFLHQLGII